MWWFTAVKCLPIGPCVERDLHSVQTRTTSRLCGRLPTCSLTESIARLGILPFRSSSGLLPCNWGYYEVWDICSKSTKKARFRFTFTDILLQIISIRPLICYLYFFNFGFSLKFDSLLFFRLLTGVSLFLVITLGICWTDPYARIIANYLGACFLEHHLMRILFESSLVRQADVHRLRFGLGISLLIRCDSSFVLPVLPDRVVLSVSCLVRVLGRSSATLWFLLGLRNVSIIRLPNL